MISIIIIIESNNSNNNRNKNSNNNNNSSNNNSSVASIPEGDSFRKNGLMLLTNGYMAVCQNHGPFTASRFRVFEKGWVGHPGGLQDFHDMNAAWHSIAVLEFVVLSLWLFE